MYPRVVTKDPTAVEVEVQAAYGAMFLGQYAPAIAAADELIETMPEAMLRIPSPPMADLFESFVAIKQHVLVRFGKWLAATGHLTEADQGVLHEEVDREIHIAALQSREPVDTLKGRLTQDGGLARIREQMKREKTAQLLYERLPA